MATDKSDTSVDEEDKLDSETALAKIKVRIAHFYEMKGREDYADSYGEEQELLEEIDDILSDTDIDIKKVIIEKLELEKMYKKIYGGKRLRFSRGDSA